MVSLLLFPIDTIMFYGWSLFKLFFSLGCVFDFEDPLGLKIKLGKSEVIPIEKAVDGFSVNQNIRL